MRDKFNKIKEIFTRFRGLTTLGFGNIVSAGISAIFWFYLASLLGAEDYGQVSYFIAIASISSTISFLGAGNTIIVYTAKGEKIQSPVFFISIISSAVTLIAVFIIFSHIGVSLYILGYVVFSLATSELLGRKMYGNYTKYLITQKILMTGFAILLYHFLGVEGVILGIALSFFPYSIRIYKSFKESKIDLKLIKPRFSFMMNSYALDLSRTFSASTDKLLIFPMFGFTILGHYQLGIQFLSILSIIPSIVYQFILPEDSSGNSNHKLKKYTVIFSIILAFLGITLSPFVLPVLFPKFTDAIEIVQIVSLSIIPATINLIYISKYLGKVQSKIVLIGSGVFLLVQITAIFMLGQVFGVNGIAAALLIATTSEAIFLIVINRIFYKF
ncbi:MAG: oligosaccharide flippase family protein [Nitrosarchaeum sp.]